MTPWQRLRGPLVAIAVLAYAVGTAAAVAGLGVMGTPPPPYGDPGQAMTNALGGVGRTQGWTVPVPITNAIDVLADASVPAAIKTDVEDPTSTYFTRFVTVKRVKDNASDANLALCARLGPNTDSPALACVDAGSTGQGGGCYLTASGDACTFTIRPIQQCTSYATCHQPLWLVASGGTTLTSWVSVSVVW